MLVSAWKAFSCNWLPLSDTHRVTSGLKWVTNVLSLMYSHEHLPYDQKYLCLGMLKNELKSEVSGAEGWEITFKTFVNSMLGHEFSEREL